MSLGNQRPTMGAPWFTVRHLEEEAGLVGLSANFTLYRDMSDRMMSLPSASPGGHTALDASALEAHAVVQQGSLTVITEALGQRQETQLNPLDSVAIAPHESRHLYNHSRHEARVLLAMPMPPFTHPG